MSLRQHVRSQTFEVPHAVYPPWYRFWQGPEISMQKMRAEVQADGFLKILGIDPKTHKIRIEMDDEYPVTIRSMSVQYVR